MVEPDVVGGAVGGVRALALHQEDQLLDRRGVAPTELLWPVHTPETVAEPQPLPVSVVGATPRPVVDGRRRLQRGEHLVQPGPHLVLECGLTLGEPEPHRDSTGARSANSGVRRSARAAKPSASSWPSRILIIRRRASSRRRRRWWVTVPELLLGRGDRRRAAVGGDVLGVDHRRAEHMAGGRGLVSQPPRGRVGSGEPAPRDQQAGRPGATHQPRQHRGGAVLGDQAEPGELESQRGVPGDDPDVRVEREHQSDPDRRAVHRRDDGLADQHGEDQLERVGGQALLGGGPGARGHR